jgi:hypothetical protein
MPYVDKMFDVFNKLRFFILFCSYNWYTNIKKKYIGLINWVFKFVEEDQYIVFSIVMPSFPKLYKKTKGKLFLWFIHLLKAKKK